MTLRRHGSHARRPLRRYTSLTERDASGHIKWMRQLERRLGRRPTEQEYRAEHMRLARFSRERHTQHARTR